MIEKSFCAFLESKRKRLRPVGGTTSFVVCSTNYFSYASTNSHQEKLILTFSRMDAYPWQEIELPQVALQGDIDEVLQKVALQGDIDALYELIKQDVKLLERFDELPFVDTPLHIAASVGQIAFAREMIGLKPSFSRKLNSSGLSPIHLALRNGHIDLVHRLLQFDEDLVRVKGREGRTPLHHAVANGNYFDLLEKFLLACPDSIADVTIWNETALHIALKYDNLGAFKLLVGWLKRNWSNDASFYGREILNWKDKDGNTLLHIAASKNMTQASSLHLENMRKILPFSNIGPIFIFWGANFLFFFLGSKFNIF